MSKIVYLLDVDTVGTKEEIIARLDSISADIRNGDTSGSDWDLTPKDEKS